MRCSNPSPRPALGAALYTPVARCPPGEWIERARTVTMRASDWSKSASFWTAIARTQPRGLHLLQAATSVWHAAEAEFVSTWESRQAPASRIPDRTRNNLGILIALLFTDARGSPIGCGEGKGCQQTNEESPSLFLDYLVVRPARLIRMRSDSSRGEPKTPAAQFLCMSLFSPGHSVYFSIKIIHRHCLHYDGADFGRLLVL